MTASKSWSIGSPKTKQTNQRLYTTETLTTMNPSQSSNNPPDQIPPRRQEFVHRNVQVEDPRINALLRLYEQAQHNNYVFALYTQEQSANLFAAVVQAIMNPHPQAPQQPRDFVPQNMQFVDLNMQFEDPRVNALFRLYQVAEQNNYIYTLRSQELAAQASHYRFTIMAQAIMDPRFQDADFNVVRDPMRANPPLVPPPHGEMPAGGPPPAAAVVGPVPPAAQGEAQELPSDLDNGTVGLSYNGNTRQNN